MKNNDNSDKKIQNPIAVAMMARHGNTTTVMRDRRNRRLKDKKKSWKSEEW